MNWKVIEDWQVELAAGLVDCTRDEFMVKWGAFQMLVKQFLAYDAEHGTTYGQRLIMERARQYIMDMGQMRFHIDLPTIKLEG